MSVTETHLHPIALGGNISRFGSLLPLYPNTNKPRKYDSTSAKDSPPNFNYENGYGELRLNALMASNAALRRSTNLALPRLAQN